MHVPFDIILPASVPLQTKNLSCVYEQGMLRCIMADNTELIRMIYSAVRDHNWGTVPFSVSDEKIIQHKDSFMVSYAAKYSINSIEYEASFFIEGKSDDTISFTMQGKALNDFMSNRIGLCVHLPVAACSGRECIISKTNGEEIISEFPRTISPHQPFTDIQQMRWRTESGTTVQMLFSGEVFEAEDQRNWMDNSYKIYSRPLYLAFPFAVKTGEAMQQSFYLGITPAEADINDTGSAPDMKQPVQVPGLCIAAAAENILLGREEIALLHELPFTHYRAELDFENDWKTIFAIHKANAEAIGAKLTLVLFFTDDYDNEARLFLQMLAECNDAVASILPQHKKHKVTTVLLQQYFYPLVKATFPGIQVGYGTDMYFTELNRQRPENDLYDFVSFSLNPQVHSFDAITILQNIQTIPDIIATIRSFTGKPVVVSPVTFRKRKNHDGAGASRHDLVNNYDERQHTWFGAGWFLLCLYALHNVQQVCFFTTTGDSGIIGHAQLTPLYKILKKLKAFSPVNMVKKHADGSLQIIFRNKADEELVFLLDNAFDY